MKMTMSGGSRPATARIKKSTMHYWRDRQTHPTRLPY